MSIVFLCKCGKKLKAPDEAAGKARARCPQCGHEMTVPAKSSVAASGSGQGASRQRSSASASSAARSPQAKAPVAKKKKAAAPAAPAAPGPDDSNALSLALDVETTSKPTPTTASDFEEPAAPRVTLASDIKQDEEEKKPGFKFSLNLPWVSIIVWAVFLSLPILAGWAWMRTIGLNFSVEAAQPVEAYVALSKLERLGPVNLRFDEVDPSKPGQAVKTPFSHWGLTGKLDNRNAVGGRDSLVLVKPNGQPSHIILRIIVSQGFLEDRNIGGMDDVRFNSVHWALEGPDGFESKPTLLRWRMNNPSAINIGTSKGVDPRSLIPDNCQPTEAKHNRRELLDLPDSGSMTFMNQGCTGKIDYYIRRPMGMASAGGFSATGDLRVETPAGFRMDLTYTGGVMGVRWPNERKGWWGAHPYIVRKKPFEQSKQELIMMFELPENPSGDLSLTVQGESIASIDPTKAFGSVNPDGMDENEAMRAAK